MQLNIYVPSQKSRLLRELDEASRRTGRPKNELVMEALERYLPTTRPTLGRHRLGEVKGWHRRDLYERRLAR
jgi:metal-responsive CopG/Arc/MetJ family transcriptional regulator